MPDGEYPSPTRGTALCLPPSVLSRQVSKRDNHGMTIRIGSIVMGAADVQRAMAFWAEALGYVPREEPEDAWVVLTPASGDGPNISLALSETPAPNKPRVHIDLYADEQQAEIQRLCALGASRVQWSHYPRDADFVVLADTEGNRFCVIDRGSH